MVSTNQQVNGRLGRRQQNSVYLGDSGQTTSSCQSAVVYSLVNGQLFANSTTGSLQFGTSTGTTYANFTPSANPGDITTSFAVDSQNNLLWSNPAFYSNFARFCVMTDTTIISVFGNPALAPSDCLFVSLSMTRVNTCAAAAAAAQNYIGPTGEASQKLFFGLSC
jgi:hypothetical protein